MTGQLVRTGIPGLDEVMLGGVQRNNNILVEGAPGAGKTTLGLGFIHAGAAFFDEPGVIVSFEMEAEKLLRDARGFDYDLQRYIDAGQVRILQTTPSVLLSEFRTSDGAFSEELRSLGAKRLLIDGLTPLKLYADLNDGPFREDVHLLVEGLSRLGLTTMVTAERAEGGAELAAAHERFVFDTILRLDRTEVRRRVHRTISVVKSRGQDFVTGSHAMRIKAGVGVEVFMRAQAAPKGPLDQPTSNVRLSTGSEPLDAMMDGGVYEGSITMVTGISGTGKTVLGTQFLTSAIRAGHKALFVTLDEHPRQLMRNAGTLGIDLQPLVDSGQLTIHYESPLELELDVHFASVVKLVESNQIDVVVFDSVAVYESASDEAADFLYALVDYMKGRLATVFFNYESPELLGVSQISQELKGSHLVDNIILLSYVEISTRLRRAIAVPKVRGSNNVQVTREYVIAQGGIALVDEPLETDAGSVPQLPFSSYYGLLARSPSRKSPAIEEAVAQGTAMPESPELSVDSPESSLDPPQ